MNNLKYHALMLLTTTIVAGSFISAQVLTSKINPVSLTFMRFALSALILSPFIFLKKERRTVLISVFPKGMIISFFYSLFFFLMFKALKKTTTLNTSTLYTLVPFMTALAGVIVFREKIRPGTLLVYLISTIGTLWVISRGDISVLLSLHFNSGDAVFMLGATLMVGYSTSMKFLYKGEEKLVMVFSMLAGGSLWMWALLLISGQSMELSKMSIDLTLHMAYLTLLSTLLTSWAMQTAIINMGPRQVSAYIYLSPALVAIVSLITRGENISSSVYPGIFLSVLSTIFLQRLAEKEKTNARNS